jgi:hypothetical protein
MLSHKAQNLLSANDNQPTDLATLAYYADRCWASLSDKNVSWSNFATHTFFMCVLKNYQQHGAKGPSKQRRIFWWFATNQLTLP